MIQRELTEHVRAALKKYPIVAITGPRQSGKTTFAKLLCPDYQYVNLEDISMRDFANQDPKSFLETYQGGAIIDEIQYVPDLFSYLQVYTDQRQHNGEYIITGSQNFLMMERISQSLAGRVAIFNLLPFSLEELKKGNVSLPTVEGYLLSGSYPRRWLHDIDPHQYYENYLRTYIERDVRLIKNISDLGLFQRFLQLLAGRVGQLFNQSSLGVELGIDNKTVDAWMTLLEVSFIAFRLQPYHRNFNKRVVKTPKTYFYDTGVLCNLLNIRTAEEINIHFAKGQLFENLVILEMLKNKYNQSVHGDFYFWREASGKEVDLIIDQGVTLKAFEIKSGKTIQPDFFKAIADFKKLHDATEGFVVYGGRESQKRNQATVISVFDLGHVL